MNRLRQVTKKYEMETNKEKIPVSMILVNSHKKNVSINITLTEQ